MRNTSSDQVRRLLRDIQMPAADVRDLLRLVQARFALPQRLLGLLVLGDIVDGAAHEHDPAAAVALRFAAARHRSDRAIGAHHLQLELERRPRLDRPFHRGGQPREAFSRVEAGVLLEARRRHLRIAAGDAIQPFRPRDGVGRGIPPPAAHPRQTLRLSQLLLASVQRPFARAGVPRRCDRCSGRSRPSDAASRVIIATIITVIPLHSENRPAE